MLQAYNIDIHGDDLYSIWENIQIHGWARFDERFDEKIRPT